MINLRTPRNLRRRRAICREIQPGIESLEPRLVLSVGPFQVIQDSTPDDASAAEVGPQSDTSLSVAQANAIAEDLAYDPTLEAYEDGAHDGEGYPEVSETAETVEEPVLVFHAPDEEVVAESPVVNQIVTENATELASPVSQTDTTTTELVGNSADTPLAESAEDETESGELEFREDEDSDDSDTEMDDEMTATRSKSNDDADADSTEMEQSSDDQPTTAEMDPTTEREDDSTRPVVIEAAESAAIDQFFSTESALEVTPTVERSTVSVEDDRKAALAGATVAAIGYSLFNRKSRGKRSTRSNA